MSLTKQVRLLEARKKAGDEAFKRGAYQEAVVAWTECLGVDPSLKAFNAKLYNNRATAFGKLRRHQEAVDHCGQAIALEPGYVKAFRRRAESLYAMGGASFVLMRVRVLGCFERRNRCIDRWILTTQTHLPPHSIPQGRRTWSSACGTGTRSPSW